MPLATVGSATEGGMASWALGLGLAASFLCKKSLGTGLVFLHGRLTLQDYLEIPVPMVGETPNWHFCLSSNNCCLLQQSVNVLSLKNRRSLVQNHLVCITPTGRDLKEKLPRSPEGGENSPYKGEPCQGRLLGLPGAAAQVAGACREVHSGG